jgi:hypothetical protein
MLTLQLEKGMEKSTLSADTEIFFRTKKRLF